MVLITKDEKEQIIKQYPNTCIVRTVRQKSKRHRYYCEESRNAMKLLRKIRGLEDTRDNKKNRYRGNGK